MCVCTYYIVRVYFSLFIEISNYLLVYCPLNYIYIYIYIYIYVYMNVYVCVCVVRIYVSICDYFS